MAIAWHSAANIRNFSDGLIRHRALYLQTELEAAATVPGQRDFFYGTVPWLVRLGWGRRRDRASAPSGGAARQPNGLEKDGQVCGGDWGWGGKTWPRRGRFLAASIWLNFLEAIWLPGHRPGLIQGKGWRPCRWSVPARSFLNPGPLGPGGSGGRRTVTSSAGWMIDATGIGP